MKQLTIGNKTFTNRFFLGTGKFASSEQTKAALAASETELVTVALTRVHEGDSSGDNILKAIDRSKVEVMLNTSGARNADEAVRIAKIGKATGFNWIKIEVHPDARYLLPDPVETLEAVRACAKLGMVVLPSCAGGGRCRDRFAVPRGGGDRAWRGRRSRQHRRCGGRRSGEDGGGVQARRPRGGTGA